MPRSELRLVTPAIAEDWLSHCIYERQRRRADWQVGRLAIEMEKGRFLHGTQIHFGIINGQQKLVNGQHTLAAIVRSNLPIELSVLYTDVHSEEELGQLYGRHDRHRGRTPHDAFLGRGLSHRFDLAEQEVNAVGTALRYILNDFRRPSVHTNVEAATSIDLVADAMERWAPYARKYFELVREARSPMKAPFRRGPVVAIGLVTFMYQEAKASDFWGGAAADDGLVRDDPRRALNTFLAMNSSGHGDPITYHRNVAAAWNRFFENGTMQILRPSDSGKIGVTIRGTPYKAIKKRRVVGTAVDEVEVEDSPATPAVQKVFAIYQPVA